MLMLSLVGSRERDEPGVTTRRKQGPLLEGGMHRTYVSMLECG